MPLKIFITEDDTFYGKILTTKLEIDGYEVKVVDNGQKLLDLLNTDTPDLIILDLLTPVLDGFETLKRIKENMPHLKDVPKVVLTNLSQSEDVTKTKELGAVDHIIKTDLSIQELVFRIKKYIPRKSVPDDGNKSLNIPSNTDNNAPVSENTIIKSHSVPPSLTDTNQQDKVTQNENP